MTLYLHELKQGRKTCIIWTLAIAAFMAMCVLLYPQMKGEMDSFTEMFASMGSFSAAFGMDKLDFGSLIGFYSVECGNILSVGGGFFAAIISVNILSKEEKEHTAEFLLIHPLTRGKVLISKLAAIFSEIILMNLIVTACSVLCIIIIDEPVPTSEVMLLHLAYFICQIELALICFAISAFTRSNNFGIGLGLTLVLYFMSVLANVSDVAKPFKIISPFGYTEGSDILINNCLDMKLIVLGLTIGLCAAIAGAYHYQRKDIL